MIYVHMRGLCANEGPYPEAPALDSICGFRLGAPVIRIGPQLSPLVRPGKKRPEKCDAQNCMVCRDMSMTVGSSSRNRLKDSFANSKYYWRAERTDLWCGGFVFLKSLNPDKATSPPACRVFCLKCPLVWVLGPSAGTKIMCCNILAVR